MSKQYINHLEWENIEFPLRLHNIEFENYDSKPLSEAIIEISRKDDYKLEAILYGRSVDASLFENDYFSGVSNIVTGQTITGIDERGNQISLQECFIATWSTSSINFTNEGYSFKAIILLDSCRIVYNNTDDVTTTSFKYLHWFICGKSNVHFTNVTIRKFGNSPRKIRVGVDDDDNEISSITRTATSHSRDYIKVVIKDELTIVAKVPEEFLPEWVMGICFESALTDSDTPNDNSDLEDFLSFILGTQLIYIGFTKLNKEGILLESFMQRSWSQGIKEQCQRVMPPIRFNTKYQWGNLEWLVEKLFTNYKSLNNKLGVKKVIARYFVALNTPLGANLPILANAIEILTGNYLKISGKVDLEYLNDVEFLSLIDDELKIIEQKLKNIVGGDIMFRKIKGVNKRNSNEKINLFFSLINVKIGKSEKEAIALRNKMVHSARDYSVEKNVHDDLYYSRIYQVLFNRVVLKLLGYDGYYIDYSLKKSPLKHIDLSAGNGD